MTGDTYDITVQADTEDGGFVAWVVGHPGCVTQGETIPEVCANIGDALAGWLRARSDAPNPALTHMQPTPTTRTHLTP